MNPVCLHCLDNPDIDCPHCAPRERQPTPIIWIVVAWLGGALCAAVGVLAGARP